MRRLKLASDVCFDPVTPGEMWCHGLAIFATVVSLQFYTAELGNMLNSFLDLDEMGDFSPTGASLKPRLKWKKGVALTCPVVRAESSEAGAAAVSRSRHTRRWTGVWTRPTCPPTSHDGQRDRDIELVRLLLPIPTLTGSLFVTSSSSSYQ
jgi:hypothetical protein